jgi:Skp family chaperone for outer membrane proteins
MTARSLILTLAALALAAFVSPAAPALAQGTAVPTKVAICNPARIFNEIQETKDLKAKLENDLKVLEGERTTRQTKIKDAQAARDALKSDSPQWTERNQELLRLAIDYDVWQKTMQADLEGQQKRQMATLFNKITQSVAQVAAAKGLDLVIAEQRPDLPENMDQIQVNDLRARLTARNVLFNTPQVDISNDIIAAMDAAYKSGK